MALPQLAGVAEAAKVLGVELTRIARYRRDGRMPPTVADLASTPVWTVESLEAMRDNDNRWPAGLPRPRRLRLFSTAEAAVRYGVSKRAIARWRDAGIFPAPDVELAAGPIWTTAKLRRFEPPRARRARVAAAG